MNRQKWMRNPRERGRREGGEGRERKTVGEKVGQEEEENRRAKFYSRN